jgi:hypothetical protein
MESDLDKKALVIPQASVDGNTDLVNPVFDRYNMKISDAAIMMSPAAATALTDWLSRCMITSDEMKTSVRSETND